MLLIASINLLDGLFLSFQNDFEDLSLLYFNLPGSVPKLLRTLLYTIFEMHLYL